MFLRPLFHIVAATKSNELFVAACLLVVIGGSLVTALSRQSITGASNPPAETQFSSEFAITKVTRPCTRADKFTDVRLVRYT
jgi:hypothetical protein